MDNQTKNNELTKIFQNYKDLIPSSLHLQGELIQLPHFPTKSSYILFKIEGSNKVSVDLQGWYLLGDNERFETFEGLMMNKFKSFQELFGSELIRKLNTLNYLQLYFTPILNLIDFWQFFL